MIIYRYLLIQFLKVLFLCVFSFLGILLTTRLQEIAQFASLGAPPSMLFWFAFYQLPYILPIAIPISCLISTIVLIQKLSSTHELTALRASGLSLRKILAPLLIASAFLSVVNFMIVSEVATHAHLASRMLEQKLRAINPLLLLQHKHITSHHGIYVNSLAPSRSADAAEDLVIAFWNHGTEKSSLFLAKKLQSTSTSLDGKQVTTITGLDSGDDENFDNLLVENIQEMHTSLEDFSQLIKKSRVRIHNDYLTLPLLLARIQNEGQKLQQAKRENKPAKELKTISRHYNRSLSDVFRRLSIAIAVFTFTLMGTAFGIGISRHRSQRGVLFVIGLAALYLTCFFAAKGVEGKAYLAALLYMGPHLLIVGISIWTLWKVSRGIE